MKLSLWRGARWLLAYGKYEWPPYYSSKPEANEEGRFENSHCGGRAVLTTPSDKFCPSSCFLWTAFEKLKPCNSNPEITNAGTTNNIDILTLDVCILPRIFISFAMIANSKKLFQNSIRTLLAHLHKNILLRGTWEWQNEFWQNLQLTQYLLQIKWSPHAWSHSSQTFHGIARFGNQLVDLHTLVLYYLLILIWWNCLPAMTSAW